MNEHLFEPDLCVGSRGRNEAADCVKSAKLHLLTLSLSQLFWPLEFTSLQGLPWASFEKKCQVI
jgi:hypothetical protein